MEQGTTIERRRGRRVLLHVPLLIRRVDQQGPSAPLTAVTRNLGLAGVYFETDAASALAVNEVVIASVSVPEAQRRVFPFTRMSGKSRVVRVEVLDADQSHPTRIGVALEFGDEVTALSAIPARG